MGLVDADTHVIECEDTWSYIPESQKELRPEPITVRDETGAEQTRWLLEGRLQLRNVGDPALEPPVRDLTDLPGRIRRMDAMEVDVQVLFPTIFLEFWTRRPELQVALCRSYNRWLAERCGQAPDRLKWVVAPPLLDMRESLAELEWGKAHGAVGIVVRGLEGVRQASDDYFFPLYERANDLDIPVCIHSGNGNPDMVQILVDNTMNHYFAGVTPVLGAFNGILTSDMPRRFPKLRIAFIETGADWVPYMIREVIRRADRIGTAGLTNAHTALRDNRFFVTTRTTDDLPYVLGFAGDTNFFIGTDFGHNDPAGELDALRTLGQRGDVSKESLHRIMDANARVFYGI